jgi:5-methylcytosine-specific restriction endonuclease McrA
MPGDKKRTGMKHKRIKALRLEAVMRQGNKCYWCKQYMTVPQSGDVSLPTDASLEHVVPIADGGSKRKKTNLVAACMKCNTTRPSKKSLRDSAKAQAEALARKALA